MIGGKLTKRLKIDMDDRKLSVMVMSLFSSWMLSFLFEGQILYSFTDNFDLNIDLMVFGGVASILAGLFICGFIIKTKKDVKRIFLASLIFFIASSFVFFLSPSFLWTSVIIISSFLSGICTAAWGFYFKSSTPKNERIKTAADVLIYSNILMVLLNVTAIHLSPQAGIALSILFLSGAFLFALHLPVDDDIPMSVHLRKGNAINITGLLAFLCLFIVIITINSGLMYHVIIPSFEHLKWLTSWYWAIPYIVAVYIMKNLPMKTNRTYILYIALAMIGFSFIAFVGLDNSAPGYFVVNTLMLGACGIYDLFWWSILGEMLDFHENPAKIFGLGLSANVLGVLLGGLIGDAIGLGGTQTFTALTALAVVCVTLAILPLLHKHLSSMLKDHSFLVSFCEMSPSEQSRITDKFTKFSILSERESEVASLLIKKNTYKEIAAELYISENTVKYYVKNIYSKYNVQSRAELIDKILSKE